MAEHLHLYDTARQQVVPFEPGPRVTMYVCGITPYDSTHLGHAFTYLTYDLLTRRLEDRGHEVAMVRNITDVDDSILPKARELGVDFLDLAAQEVARFHNDLEVLDVRPALSEPRATESIEDMLELIEVLRDRGHTYTVDGTTYFDVTTFERFGQLSHYDEATMIELARERGGRPDDEAQRHPLDFVLWQPSADDEPRWESPFGAGRPGWHIECSAMAMAAHGATIDLHGGGADLIFPHHECEIAQSEAGSAQPFVRHWLHGGLVAYAGTKMSKSLGNLVFVSELSKVADGRAIRLALLPHHYRGDWEWFDDDIDRGIELFEALRAAVGPLEDQPPVTLGPRSPGGPILDAVRAALDDDLDTPLVSSILRDAADTVDESTAPAGRHDLRCAAALVGIDLARPPLH